MTDVLIASLDRLPQQIAVLDDRADIVWVNRSWVDFGLGNGGKPVDWDGVNYFEPACSEVTDDETVTIVDRLRDVADGRAEEFSAEYPCFSPTEDRWFCVNALALTLADSRFVVMSHHDVTDRYVAEHQANTDPLTGLANRRRFDEFLAQHWYQAMRFSVPISVLSVDIDDFKHHNDRLGHDAGDQVLGELARTLESVCRRSTDLAARIGGDEFAVVLAGVDEAVARDLAETIRTQFTQNVLDRIGVHATVSIGVAIEQPVIGARFGELTARADEGLMNAKRTGRDRVSVADQR